MATIYASLLHLPHSLPLPPHLHLPLLVPLLLHPLLLFFIYFFSIFSNFMGKTSPAEIDICEGKVCKRLWHTYETHEREGGGRA